MSKCKPKSIPPRPLITTAHHRWARALTVGIALAAASRPAPLQALAWHSPVEEIKKFTGGRQAFELLSFETQRAGAERGLSLFNKGQVSFREAVSSVMRERMRNNMIELRSGEVSASFGLNTGAKTHEFRFYVRGVPLCGFQVRAHEFADRSVLVLGTLPQLDINTPPPDADWPDVNLAREHIAHDLSALSGSAGPVITQHISRCLHVADGGLLPVWKMTVAQDGLPYEALADAYETVSLTRAYFDVDGSAKVYPFNSVGGQPLTDIKLPGLTGEGLLKSDYLKIYVPSGYQLAQSPDHVFNYGVNDGRFVQASAFAHVQQHFEYFQNLGFAWYGPRPLEVQLHVKPAGRINNALFVPGNDATNTLPTISIHDGDGIDLQNLCLDSDVISHEFGHHVIYKTLRSTEGQSLVLHEGLADFFAFMRSGDSCLGESICPAGSGACVVETKCLRTASNTMAYKDELWNAWAGPRYRLGHLHGQLISGLLWDLRKDGKIPAKDLAQLVFRAISLFEESSGFRDLAITLFKADRELFAGTYMSALRSVMEARNLGEFLEGIPSDATSPLPGLTDDGSQDAALPGGSQPEPASPPKKSKGSSNPFHCGVLGDGSTAAGTSLLGLLLILVPFLPALKPALAPARRRRATHRPPGRHR